MVSTEQHVDDHGRQQHGRDERQAAEQAIRHGEPEGDKAGQPSETDQQIDDDHAAHIVQPPAFGKR